VPEEIRNELALAHSRGNTETGPFLTVRKGQLVSYFSCRHSDFLKFSSDIIKNDNYILNFIHRKVEHTIYSTNIKKVKKQTVTHATHAYTHTPM